MVGDQFIDCCATGHEIDRDDLKESCTKTSEILVSGEYSSARAECELIYDISIVTYDHTSMETSTIFDRTGRNFDSANALEKCCEAAIFDPNGGAIKGLKITDCL